MFFKLNGDSNLFQDQIVKNIFEIGSKYFRISKSVDMIEVHQIQIFKRTKRSCQKMGKIRYCNVEAEDLCLDIGSELMAVFIFIFNSQGECIEISYWLQQKC